jgi:hypothetical protein
MNAVPAGATRRIAIGIVGVGVLAALGVSGGAHAQEIPTAETVIARHDAALGGREALDKHSTMKLTGTVRIAAAGLSGTIEILRGKPNWYVETTSFSRTGDLLTGFDGAIAWELTRTDSIKGGVAFGGSPAILTDADADVVKSQANWYHEFVAPQALRGARVDTVEFEGQSAWRLTYASALGLEVRVYYDRETGLRMGESWTGAGGENTLLQSDYKTFDGVKLPTRLVNRASAGERVVTIKSVEFDHVDATAFALPAAVRVINK